MNKKVSLVLSGGGARGTAHIGVIEEIEKQGFEIYSISGTSMGALVGGVFALGKMEECKNWLFTLDKMKIFNLLDFSFSTQGLVKGDKIFNKMKDFIPDSNIEDLKISYTAVAADIINKKEVAIKEGSVFDAIRASIALPTVFTPIKTKNGLLVDGGVLNNIPINHAKRSPDDILIVVNVNADSPVYKPTVSKKERELKQSIYQKKIRDFYNQFQKNSSLSKTENIGYFELISKTISLMTYQMSQISLKLHSPDILINISRDSCGIYDFFRAEEMVEIGRYAANKSITEYINRIVD